MNSLGHEMPRFDDGTVNIRGLVRVMAESPVNEIMDVQAEDACADGNRRNGYRGRALVTSVGTIGPRIPKLRRGSCFPEDPPVRCSRVDRAVVAAVSEMVSRGVSTRKVERAASATGVDRMGSSWVSRIRESPDETVADLRERGLSDVASPSSGWTRPTPSAATGAMSRRAPVAAMGAGADGHRRPPGTGAIDAESRAGRLPFPRSLRGRGASGVARVTSDAREGLGRAIEEVLRGPPGRDASCTS